MTSNLFAVDGVISGLKTGDIIQQMMAIERLPLNRIALKKQQEQQRAAAIADVSAGLTLLQSKVRSLTLQSTVNARSAVSSAAATVTATANADAANGAYQVRVDQLATATKVTGATVAGLAVVPTSALASVGLAVTPSNGTFSINGVSINVADVTTTKLDDGTAASLVGLITNAGAGVTATLVNDPDGRVNRLQLVSAPGQSIQLGAGADTSNLLSALRLAGSQVTGNTASQVGGSPVAAGAINASFTVNGKQVTVATGGGNTAADNAEALRLAINAAGAGVTATVNPDDSLLVTHDTSGAAGEIVLAGDPTAAGLAAGTTRNGTDKVVSSTNLGVVNTGAALSSAGARLATALGGLDGDGNGAFSINGVSIAYNGSESLTTVLNRINASSAGVTAGYDPVGDRVSLRSVKTGTALISLSDTTGNFLSAIGVAGTTQETGKTALFSIDSVNGGQQLSSATNTVSAVLPGVTLELKEVSATAATITVSQNTGATVTAAREFVEGFNSVMDRIRKYTAYDATTQKSGLLAGDSAFAGIASQLRQLVSAPALGASGSYRSLANIGISTGKVGTAVGAANTLTLDEAKLTAALQDNPGAVETVLRGFASTATLAGAGPVTSVTGTPTGHHEAGSYQVTSVDGIAVTATFTTAAGTVRTPQTGTLGVGVNDLMLITGMGLTGSGAAGTNTITVAVQQRGVALALNDFLIGLTSPTGFFKTRTDQSTKTLTELDRQAVRTEQRVADKESALRTRFSLLEQAMARLQAQSTQLSGVIAKMNGSE